MKKVISIFIMIAVIIIIAILTLLWSKNSDLEYRVINKYVEGHDIIISNFEEYQGLIQDKELREIIDSPRYNKNFFKNKQLIVAFIITGSGSNKITISNVEKEDNRINISYSIKYPDGGIGTCDMSGKVIIIESKGKNINEIEYN